MCLRKLDRDQPPQSCVVRLPDLAHAAGAERDEQFIGSQSFALYRHEGLPQLSSKRRRVYRSAGLHPAGRLGLLDRSRDRVRAPIKAQRGTGTFHYSPAATTEIESISQTDAVGFRTNDRLLGHWPAGLPKAD